MNIDFGGRPCVVVGGAGGNIGSAIVNAVADSGGTIGIITNVEEHADAAIKDLEARGVPSAAVVADATDEEAMVKAMAELSSKLGVIRHLVNVVGGMSPGDYYWTSEFNMAAFDRVIDINLRYAVVTSREIVHALKVAGLGGSIVNVSSVASHGAPYMGAYSAAKAGMEAFTRTMAIELGPSGIRVNAVSSSKSRHPDYVDPSLVEAAVTIPLRRLGEAKDIAGATLFMLSDLASYITGQVLEVDGGYTLGYPGGDGISPFLPREVREGVHGQE